MRAQFDQLFQRLEAVARTQGPTARLARVALAPRGQGDSAQSQRATLFAFTVRILGAAIAYAMQVLMARWMGDYQYGIYVTVWVAIVVLGGLSCFGLQTAVIRYISEYRASHDMAHLRGVIRGSMNWAFLAASVLAALGAGFVLVIDDVPSYYVVPIYLAAVCLPMMALSEVMDGVARAFNWPGTALTPTFLVRPLLILGFMALFIALNKGADARYAMLAAVCATYMTGMLQFAILTWRLRGVVPAGPRVFLPRQWILVALPIFLVDGFYNILWNMDVLFVSYYMPPDQVGVYFAAVKTLALAHFVYFAVKAGTAHRFAAYRSAGDKARYEEFVRETVQWTFWPSLALALLMAIFGRFLLSMFGENFVAGADLLWILGIGIVIRAAVGPAATILVMSGEQIACAGVYAACLFVNVVLNIVLIPRYGLEGAAIAVTLAIIFEAAALYAAARRRLGIRIFIMPSALTPAAGNGVSS